uniref:Olfactory receptor n=1 Tax=Lates calcarifer TaxID=8187 RepID=A0A4W6DWF0_LATCA
VIFKAVTFLQIKRGIMMNSTQVSYFTLAAYFDTGVLKYLFFIIIMSLYILILCANVLLIVIICMNRSLHEPMYLFLCSLFVNELYGSTGLFPFLLLQILSDIHTVPASFCFLQIYCVHSYGAVEYLNLAIMSYDRYLAICYPLQYNTRMTSNKIAFVIPLVIRNVVIILVVVTLAGRLSFCFRNVINHCFCEHMALVELACGSTAINSLVGLMFLFLVIVVDFLIITTSYIIIFSSVLRSRTSGVKALHTCVTHLVVISVSLIIVLTASLSYRVRNNLPATIRVFLSTMYSLFPSCFNPIIYGIRTKEIRQHILKTLLCCRLVQTVPHS